MMKIKERVKETDPFLELLQLTEKRMDGEM